MFLHTSVNIFHFRYEENDIVHELVQVQRARSGSRVQIRRIHLSCERIVDGGHQSWEYDPPSSPINAAKTL